MKNELQIIKRGNQLVTDSREVAEMVEKEHAKLMRDIRQYCEYLTESKVGLSEFFIESTYVDSTGRTLPCYLITRKGCDMIANKMIGKKGVLFTAQYVTQFEQMEQQLAPKCIEDVLIQSLQEMKAVKLGLDTANKRIDTIGDLLTLNPNDWRTGTKDIIVKIAEKLGGTAYIPEVHNEIYKLVEANLGVNLKRRLDNMKARMLFNGTGKSKVERLTRVDVIAEDKKLLNGYIKVIRELAIKYGIDKVEV